MYILTSPHRNTEGIFRMPLTYAATDLGWPVKRLERVVKRLEQDKFIAYDRAAHVCLILNALKWQGPENPNQVKAAVRAVAELPPSPLVNRFRTLAATLAPTLAQELLEELAEPAAKALPNLQAPSSSSSSKGPPDPPQAGGRPAPPEGNRDRDQQRYRQELRSWAPHPNGSLDPELRGRWSEARTRLGTAVTASTFATYLSPVHPHRTDGDTVVLGVPDATLPWIRERFGTVIRSALEGAPVDFVPCEDT